jgi:hypothetical protein
MRKIYYMAVLLCIITGLFFAFNMFIQLMYFKLYLM